MERPRKKEHQNYCYEGLGEQCNCNFSKSDSGYNQAIDSFTSWLNEKASVERLRRLLQIYLLPQVIAKETAEGIFKEGENINTLATAIRTYLLEEK